MTGNQLDYWANIERERANKAAEALRSREISQRAAELAWDKAKYAKELEFRKWQSYFNKYGVLGDTAQGTSNTFKSFGQKVADRAAAAGRELSGMKDAYREGGIWSALNASSTLGRFMNAVDNWSDTVLEPRLTGMGRWLANWLTPVQRRINEY
jgi:hypothetical protein